MRPSSDHDQGLSVGQMCRDMDLVESAVRSNASDTSRRRTGNHVIHSKRAAVASARFVCGVGPFCLAGEPTGLSDNAALCFSVSIPPSL
jgi:hypothetical protein